MKSADKKWTCPDVQEWLEAYVDAALSEQEMLSIDQHVHTCGVCQAELRLAKDIKQSLNRLPAKSCPESVTGKSLAAIRQQRFGRWQNAIAQFWQRKHSWRPVFAGAALLALALLLIDRVDWREVPPAAYSEEEIALAELDVKWTFAYLGNLGKKTGATVRDEVLEAEVVAPLQQALRSVIGREKNQ